MSDRIVFYGDSITAGFERLNDHDNIVNLGVGGDKTIELIGRFVSVIRARPTKLFIMIGTNDFLVNKRHWQEYIHIDYEVMIDALITLIQDNLKDTDVYFISIPPVRLDERYDNALVNREIDAWNDWLKGRVEELGFTYVDVASALKADDGAIAEQHTTDGVHLSETGYRTYYDLISPYFD